VVVALVMAIAAGPAWSLFETNRQLAASATITPEVAVRDTLIAVPGKAVEAVLEEKDGRTLYAVEMMDANDKPHEVRVDAQSDRTRIDP